MFLLSDTPTNMTQSLPTKEPNFSAQWIMSFKSQVILQLFCLRLLGTSLTESGFLGYYLKWVKGNKNKQTKIFLSFIANGLYLEGKYAAWLWLLRGFWYAEFLLESLV